jgi:hypothetical protein
MTSPIPDPMEKLFIRGRDLAGDDITEVPDLVQEKLTDHLTRAVPSHIARLLTTYREAHSPRRPTAISIGTSPTSKDRTETRTKLIETMQLT